MRRDICFLVAIALLFLGAKPAAGFDEEVTHPALTTESTRRSSLDASLKSEIGLTDGLVTLLRQGSNRLEVLRWLLRGSLLEDDPPCRAGHHFHNPLKPFTTSGVTNQAFVVRLGCSGSGFLPPKSSVTWGTGFLSPTVRGPATGNPFDWDTARRAFLNGLTAETPEAREAELARTFETLGHLLHLVQDLAVPAHARNDFPAHEAFFPRATLNIVQWFQEPFERFVRTNRGLVAEAAARAEKVDFVGQLVTRFWDTDRYTLANPTADLLQGLAEYTNANFASPNTIFTEDLDPSNEFAFPYPRRSSTNFNLITSKDDRLVQFVTAEDGREDRVLYLAKTGDGELIDRFLRLGFFTGDVLDKAPPGTPAKLLVQIDDDVHRAYAAKLLPRAIGYGAALLDYFFRGKLDVELFSDDGSTLQLRGTNASPDPLVDGTLKLYADVPTVDPEGKLIAVRRALTALGDTKVRGVDPGQPLSSALFQPQEAERFVAVYEGRLGNEIPVPNPDTPTLSFPGGVIGKVFGGVRVEEVFLDFADGGKWKLRTPRGIVPLKVEGRDAWLAYPAVEDLRWGDGQDQLVGRSAFGSGQPNQVVAYTVPRQPNSVELATETTPEGPLVRLSVIAEQAFLFGLPLGTTVNITHTIEYQQQLVSYDRTVVFQWTEPPGIPGRYVFTEAKFGPTRLTTVANETFRFADSFDVTLDLAHYSQFQSPTDRASYGWTLTEVGLTAAGQLVGVIRVNLAAPPFFRWPVVSQPVYGLDANGAVVVRRGCGTFVCFDETVGLRRTFPLRVDPLLWAVVDLRTGQVLGKTAEDALTITSREAVEAPRWAVDAVGPAPLVYHEEIGELVGGGPNDGTTRGWFAEAVRAWDLQPFATQTELTLKVSNEQSLAAVLRAEVSQALSQLGFLQAGLGRPGLPPTFLAFGPFGRDQKVLKVITPASGLFSPLATVEAALRARAASGPERLVLLAQGDVVGQGTFNGIVAWDPSGPQARGLLKSRMGFEEQGLSLGSATKNLAIINNAFVEGGGYLVALDGASPPRFVPDPDGLFFYVAIEPQYVYSVATQRFHSAGVTAEGITELQPTPLPLVLKNGPGGPIGDYHTIRVP